MTSKMTKETRILQETPLVADREKRTISGYGAVFNKDSQDLGGFIETIDHRAFNRTLAGNNDILVAVNHDIHGSLMGRTSSGTARVYADKVGVRYEVDVPDTTAGRDLLELAERGDIKGSSFTFSIPKNGDSWETRDGQRYRTLTEVRLYELGPVTNPAYLDTTVAVRALEELVALEDHGGNGDSDTQEATVVTSAHRMSRSTR